MGFKPQTAIRGVFSVAIINILARIIGFGKHIVITAYIGLTAQLDAYYVAVTALSIVVLSFGDVFDSLGIPRLVQTLKKEGYPEFQRLAGTIFRFACMLSAGLCLLLYAVSPVTPSIAPGFSPEKKEFVTHNLFLLAPLAALYLPSHALGSILRAKRRFKDFYVAELVNAIVLVLLLFAGRNQSYIIPMAASGASMVSFCFVLWLTWGELRYQEGIDWARTKDLFRLLFSLLPLYMTFYLYPLVDRLFASFLQTGAISALSYGLLIATIPNSIFMMENVFITPLAETRDRSTMMNHITVGVSIMTIPISTFMCAYGGDIVGVALERGAFSATSTQMTGDALRYFALAIPAFFYWPICYRLFQVLEKWKSIAVISLTGIIVNAILNYAFLRLGLGIRGLAIATAASNYVAIGGVILVLKRYRIFMPSSKLLGVLLNALLIGLIALWISTLPPAFSHKALGLAIHGGLFLATAGLLLFLSPNEDIRSWRTALVNDVSSSRIGKSE